MKIDQIPFPIKVRVMRKHIIRGICGDERKCGLSLAIREAVFKKTNRYPCLTVVGGRKPIRFGDHKWNERRTAFFSGRGTLAKIRSFITTHDKCRIKATRVKAIKPFSFVIKGVSNEEV